MRLLVSISLVAGCGGLEFEPAGPGAAPDPSIAGPFPIGVRTEVFEDVPRGRTLVTEIWYPAVASSRGEPGVEYVISEALPEEVRSEFGDLGSLVTSAVRDAEIDEAHGPYPIALFSHGNAAIRFQSTYLTVNLASHGYVVAAPDHAGNTLADFVQLEKGLVFDLESVLESYQNRPLDLATVVRKLEDLDIQRSLDFEQIGVVGHSFGAVTALRMTALDPRIGAAVSQAPQSYELSWFDMDRELDEVPTPIMLQAGGLDQITPDDPVVDSIWPHVGAGGVYVHLGRAGHFTFSDLCKVPLDTILAAQEEGLGDVEDGCGPQNVPIQIAHPLINRMTIGFFNLYLRGSLDSARFLTPDTLDPAEIAIDTR